MAKLEKVTVITPEGLMEGLLRFKGGLPREVINIAGNEGSRLVGSILQKQTTMHYENLIKEVGRKLKGSGMPSATASGGQTISFGTIGGKVGTIRTVPWKPLTEPYRKRRPKSFKMWRKEGRLFGAYNTFIAGRGSVAVQEETTKRNHHKNKVNLQFLLQFSPMPFPFNKAVSQPFVRTEEFFSLEGVEFHAMQDMTQPIDRLGLGRARFPEYDTARPNASRPFLRRMSMKLGQEMHKDILRKLRKI